MIIDTTRAELLKIRTVRSSGWALLLTVAVGSGIALLVAQTTRSSYDDMSHERRADLDPVFDSFYGLTLAQLAVVVFAVLCMGSEYSTGTIRLALAATPRRGVYFVAKIVAVALPVAAVALITVLASFVTAQAALGPLGTTLNAEGVARATAGAWIYLTLIALFALGIAAMLGNSTRALAALLPVFFLGSQGLGNVPHLRTVAQYLPDQAGSLIMHLVGPPDNPAFERSYGPWAGVGILATWTVAALAGGWLALRRRDV